MLPPRLLEPAGSSSPSRCEYKTRHRNQSTSTYLTGASRRCGRWHSRFRPGEIFGLLGPNGSGKTSLFRVLTTLLSPTAGSISVFGESVERSPASVRRVAGVVFQSQSLDRKLTVIENLRHQGHLYGLSGAQICGNARRKCCSDSG